MITTNIREWIDMSTPSERVAFGARELDRELPGWFAEIDLELLDMSLASACIIAQAARDIAACEFGQHRCYICGVKAIGWTDAEAEARAYYVSDETAKKKDVALSVLYEELQPYWVQEIQNRLALDAEVAPY